jgi:hypothetical protein
MAQQLGVFFWVLLSSATKLLLLQTLSREISSCCGGPKLLAEGIGGRWRSYLNITTDILVGAVVQQLELVYKWAVAFL